ncbi:hypothetical protein N8I77_000421 [Diaporthe amygdali]|uniref:Uncharacterized protein n=1 Tax=Phomopsis amygdali TaxID=1214568 RepID=A0AAD9SPQ8_PHOAM|nr:hypothetical protein N8I77_000421 [Diaporthe amygdali]
MGLLKIFTRRSSKSKLQAHDKQSRLDTPPQESRNIRQHEPGAPEISSATQHQPEMVHTFPDQPDHSETEDSVSAPAPFVPRHPSLVVEDRPRTATSIRSLSRDWSQFPARPKREPRRPPVSFRKPSSLVSMSTAYQSSAQITENESEINSLMKLRRNNGSRSSLGSIKSKDILDAQDEIRPTDFRSRVYATGSRDYGEDVADRNITRHRDGNISPTPDPMRMRNRTKSLNSSSLFPRVAHSYDLNQDPALALKDAPSPEPMELGSFSSRNKRRLSLNTYVPSGMVSPHTPKPVAATPDLMEDVASKDFASSAEYLGTETVARRKEVLPTFNFSRPGSPRNPQTTNMQGTMSLSHARDPVFDGKIAEVLASDNVSSSDLSSHQRTSNQSFGHVSLPRSPGRQSYQTLRSSLASSIPSRYPSTDMTPLGYPSTKHADAHADTNAVSSFDSTSGRTQSAFSHRHSRSNDSEDQISYNRTKSLGFLSSPLEADEQSTLQSGSVRNWSLSETSKSDVTAHSNLFSAASGRSHSRHTANTSLDSKSAESFITASNGQHGSEWSPATNRSAGFNIDDYVSSDDDSFTTTRKRARPSGQDEEDLLFKGGYGVTGAALPGLEALGEEDEYSHTLTRSTRSNSAASDSSVAVALSPKDTRFGMSYDLPPTLRHVRSDPEELTMSTFGRALMRNRMRTSTADVWAAEEEDSNPAVDLEESYTPSMSSIESDDPHSDADARSTVGSLGGFRPHRSESSFSVYSTGGAVTTSITGSAKALERDTYDDVRAPRRGLKRLSALGTLYGRSMGSFSSSDRRPATESGGAIREETKPSDIIRRRKEDKTRKRADHGLKSIREKRMTEAFGRPDNDGIARLREHLEDYDEMWEREI